jgi:hypothetical protein
MQDEEELTDLQGERSFKKKLNEVPFDVFWVSIRK